MVDRILTSSNSVFWGFVGNWTNVIGYHNSQFTTPTVYRAGLIYPLSAWEFWALAGYNFTQAAWGSYNSQSPPQIDNEYPLICSQSR